MAAFGFARRWVGDDGFINVRVAGQLLAGRGFVFNAGERVEAVTSPAIHNARSALGCGALAELRRATTEPLSWGRFWQNVMRAPSFHRLRVPASTWQAKWQFCGPAQRKGSA